MKNQPPVILFFDHVAKLSGGEIFLFHLLSHFDREKFIPVVVLGEDGPLREKLCAAGIETQILALPSTVKSTRKDELGKRGLIRKLASVAGVFPYIWKLRALIRRSGAKIVHTNSLKADIIGGIAGKLARRPVLWHIHDCISDQYLPGAAVRLFRGLARRLPTHIISVSRAVEETLQLPAGFSASVVHNGIPWQLSHEKADRGAADEPKLGPVIGMVGRIARWKGQHVFIEAAALLQPQFPAARFQIVGGALFGEDLYENELHAQVDRMGLNEAVEFLGFRADVTQLLPHFDIFVHASISPEPFGIVIIEAMMEGKPVVATEGGGVPEIVDNGETGILVPMNDAPALSKAIASLLDDPQTMKRMGEAGRERVREQFLIEVTVRKVESVYRRILG